MKLEQHTILITGGSSGIGSCLADQLHDAGNKIIVASRSPMSNSLNNIALKCNLAEKNSVIKLLEQLKKQKQRPSILINNAAIQSTPKFTDQDFDFNTIQTEITVNFTAVAWLTSLLLPILMSHESSAIVNISSGLALYPKTGSAIYCATKAALHSLSQSLRYQLKGTSVSVHEVLLTILVFRCPFLTRDNRCTIHKTILKPMVCLKFPLDRCDIQDVMLSSGVKCGYRFEAVSPCSPGVIGENSAFQHHKLKSGR